MVETTKNPGEKLSISPTKTLTLKGRGVEQGIVRQNFSHGRTKQVVVEKVKSRITPKGKPDAAPVIAAPANRTATARPTVVARAPTPAAPTTPSTPKPAGLVLPTLTEEEQKARGRALADARLREAEERKIAEEEAAIRKARDAIERTE